MLHRPNDAPGHDHVFKFILVGACGAGGASLVHRLVDEGLPHQRTIGVDFRTHRIMVLDRAVKLQVWYPGRGGERFRQAYPTCCRGAAGVVFVYDITDPQSFAEVQQWKQLVSPLVSEGAAMLLLGNKCDRAAERQVSTSDGRRYADAEGMLFAEVSALDGTNVDRAFMQLTAQVLERRCFGAPMGRPGGVRLPVLPCDGSLAAARVSAGGNVPQPVGGAVSVGWLGRWWSP
jgi:small GTP-binding protein